jgi:diguanylate cyclase (GGDEF)-like protein/PAS domain S-box-containing protein
MRLAIGVDFFKLCEEAIRNEQDQLAPLEEAVDAVLHGRSQGSNIEYSCSVSGTRRWFQLHVLPLTGGRTRQAQLVNVDVTDFKRVAEEQHEALTNAGCLLWHCIVEQTEGGFDWQMVLADEEAAQNFLPLPRNAGDSYLDAWDTSVDVDTHRRMDENSSRALLSGEAGYSQEYECRCADGSIRTMYEQVRIEPLGPKRWGLVGTCIDITERAQADRRIREREALYEALTETIPQLVWTCDANGIVDFFNQRWYDYTGLAPSQNPSDLWLQTVHPEDLPAAADTWNAAVAGSRPYDVEIRMRGADGAYRWFLVRGMPLKDNGGQVVRWFGTCTDIDDSKRTERNRQFISELGHLVQAAFATEDAIETMIGRIKQHLNVSHCDFATVDFEAYTYTLPHRPHSEIKETAGTYPLDHFGKELVQVLQSGDCFVSNDLSTDPRVAESYASIFQPRDIRAVVLVPVIKAGSWMAILSATVYGAPRNWLPDEIDLMGHIADQAWLALENSRLDRAAQTEMLERVRATAAAADAQSQLTDVLESMADGFLVLDKNWKYSYVNHSAEIMIGAARDKIVGKSLWELRPQIEHSGLGQMYRHSMATGTRSHCEVYDEAYGRWLGISLIPWHGGLAVYYQDITDQRRAEADLKESELRFRQLAENIDAVFWLRQGDEVLYVSPAYERIWGLSGNDLKQDQTAWINAILPEDREEILARFRDMSQEYSVTYRIVRSDGAVRWIRDRGFPVSNDISLSPRIAGLAQDITEIVEAQEHVRWQAYHDVLTGLPNRQLFTECLDKAAAEADEQHHQLAVLFVDTDNLNYVNDSLGHEAGDQVLHEIAGQFKTVLPEHCTLARIGGDEFAVLLPRLAYPSEHVSIAQRLLDSLATPLAINGGNIRVTASIGISIYPKDAHDTQSIMKYADVTMMQVKERGKNGYNVYTPGFNTVTLERIVLSNDLHAAVERNEFMLLFQPQVDAESGRIVGAEALIRWNHPTLGMVAPLKFIPLAEETGLIVPIGEWALREACRHASCWRSWGHDIRTAVNVSAHQLRRPGFTEMVQSAMRANSLDPEGLEIELTESALVDAGVAASDVLAELRSLGVAISVDDFGTGYSSLSYIGRLPINTLKADRSFVTGMMDNPRNAAVVKTVIDLASILGLDVIAEGVETEEQRRQLIEYGCRTIQGYLISRPVTADALTRMLETVAPMAGSI